MKKPLLILLVLGLVGTCFPFPDRTKNSPLGSSRKYQAPEHQQIHDQCPKPPKNKLLLKIDLENTSDKNYFSIAPDTSGYELERSHDYYKSGGCSLKWIWAERADDSTEVKLTLTLRGAKERDGAGELQRGGIKFWMYRAFKTPVSSMQITFVGKKNPNIDTRSCPTNVHLDFKGWRAVWIGYDEFIPGQFDLNKVTSVEFKITSTNADTLYIDLIQFVKGVGKQTRDIIVREVGQPYSDNCDLNDPQSTITPMMADPPTPSVPYYSEKDFWQRSLRWYDAGLSRSVDDIINVEPQNTDINTIENRLENWYADTTEALSSLSDNVAAPSGEYDFRAAKEMRWEGLLEDIKKAHEQYKLIQFDQKRPPLFTKVSDFGEEGISSGAGAMTKFGFVFSKVLLPLSIEYNFMSRNVEVQYLANRYCNDLLAQSITAELEAVVKIAGKNDLMKGKFITLVENAKTDSENPLNCQEEQNRIPSMEKVISDLNDQRFERIKTLLRFLEDQGWAEGSGLGSIDHEMNKVGAGFMHSMFLLRKALKQDTTLFNSLMGAMKWYNDFNEIYQEEDDYVYDGTTADRMRTILLYRLMIILMQPSTELEQKKDRIRDMMYFKTWFKHALKINKGLGGVIKPDYTGFHHKTFYGSAYVPHALHNAALVQYLIGGTAFALDQDSKINIRKTLKFLRTVAVKYSTPNGVCGRFPGYDNAILAEHVPAYAYSCYVHARGDVTEGVEKPEMFLRLFDPSFTPFGEYLTTGTIKSGIYYWNTIGSLDVLRKAKTLTCKNPPCSREPAPNGHWSKNFAALSIHRRNEWSVAAKGFSKYTWDYESSAKENVFGIFGSHGSLQISNSESSLVTNDVENGWDWTRVPGTTTVKINQLRNIKLSKARNYNHNGRFAGGVSFIGSDGGNPKNGAFGMIFIKPDYIMKDDLERSPLKTMNFQFKKSYFFYNSLIVCLGSDIQVSNAPNHIHAQTTLFQDALPDLDTSIQIGRNTYNRRNNDNLGIRWRRNSIIRLTDTNGNTYKIENQVENQLSVTISSQASKKSNGCDGSSGHYATAWLKHKTRRRRGNAGKRSTVYTDETVIKNIDEDVDSEEDEDDPHFDPTFSYKYAILVNGGDMQLLNKYSVIQQDAKVHAVKLSNLPGSSKKIYGYSIFTNLELSPLTDVDSPVRSASRSCMIMAEKNEQFLHLAISDPTVKFGPDPLMKDRKTCTDTERNPPSDPYNPKTSTDIGNEMMYCVEGKPNDPITITLNVRISSIISVKVDDPRAASGSNHPLPELNNDTDPNRSILVFSNLVNGFTTEVKLAL